MIQASARLIETMFFLDGSQDARFEIFGIPCSPARIDDLARIPKLPGFNLFPEIALGVCPQMQFKIHRPVPCPSSAISDSTRVPARLEHSKFKSGTPVPPALLRVLRLGRETASN